MRVEHLRCEGGRCVGKGEGTFHVTADYVFAYGATLVRFSPPDVLDVYFDEPVECESRHDPDYGVSYVYCASVLLPTRIEVDNGEVYLVEEGGGVGEVGRRE